MKITRAIYFSHRLRPPETHLALDGRNIRLVNHVKYLSVIFDKRITCKLHIEMTEAKAFRAVTRIYSLYKSERLSANIKLTFHKELIRSVMTYACPAWEFTTDMHLLNLQRLQTSLSAALKNFSKCSQVRDLHTAFSLPHLQGVSRL
jgi:hypothetical protein